MKAAIQQQQKSKHHRQQQTANPSLTSADAVRTFRAVGVAERAPPSGNGGNHTSVGGEAADAAGVSVARVHGGAAEHRMGNP